MTKFYPARAYTNGLKGMGLQDVHQAVAKYGKAEVMSGLARELAKPNAGSGNLERGQRLLQEVAKVKQQRAAKQSTAMVTRKSEKSLPRGETNYSLFLDLVIMLRALHWASWNYHWAAYGPNAYSDHLMYERIYTGIEKHIDTVVEHMIGYEVLTENRVKQTEFSLDVTVSMAEVLESLYDSNLVLAEVDRLKWAIEATISCCNKLLQLSKQDPERYLGIDDFAPAIAKKLETYKYLLQQRGRK